MVSIFMPYILTTRSEESAHPPYNVAKPYEYQRGGIIDR